MGLAPEYKILANGADITAALRDRLQLLHFTDEAGLESDTLEITLADTDTAAPIVLPPTGAELELQLGYDGKVQTMGKFVVDEIELGGWPGYMRIAARAAPFDTSKGGQINLQTQKTRSWPKGTKLADMVKKVASEHGMQSAVAPSLAAIVLPHVDQSDESDIHLLVRVAKKYDALVKPSGGKIVLAKRGETKSASGQQLQAVVLTPGDVTEFRATIAKRDDAGTVVASWHVPKQAKRQVVKVGTGEPVTRLRMGYTSKEQAQAAATAELDKRLRAAGRLSVTLPGRPELVAEAPLTMNGFREGAAGEWVISRVEHALDNRGGYVCVLDAEKPNAPGQKNVTEVTE